ncbi:thiamine pyrophosphate-binding protein [Pontivivens ytuae]|uniref:Thiamine pyrophosphate-binding protein n=1 Tax=Pontivivens ytuae TaxID=2789856 RepID=A0A7S9LSG1_9RHOB|nr:thiamine pyrophosphate-binding protein [Pontivivens ytuae]QPH54467.1 thiamine pyrophosphate-binding protein [Pontivivens ytuae]
MPNPTSAEIIALRLYEAGVRHAFGVPGGEVLELIDAMERIGIRFVLARHENAAGFMAEGAWHATGAPGVLVATVGPGMANTVNVTANAEQDRVPLIVITGAYDDVTTLRYTHQIFDHRAVLKPVVKASFEARAGACDVMIDKAVRIAQDPQPGPVHIDLPVKVAAAEHPVPGVGYLTPVSPSLPTGLDAARRRLANAKRPLIVAGLDLLQSPGAPEAVRAAAEAHGIPVVTTYKAKGVLDERHPLSLGGHGLSPKSDAILMPLIGEADLVICAGYDPIEMRTGWQDPWDRANAISFTAVPDRQAMHGVSQGWVCDPGRSLEALFDGLALSVDWGARVAETRAALDAAFAPGDDWGPAQALAILDRMRPGEMMTSVDSGAHRILMSQMWHCDRPHTLIQSTGLCTMGCALPLAMGHGLASGERSLAVMGDGCLDMILGELATLRDTAAPVICTVLNDSSLALIEMKQRRDGKQNAGVDFGATDYAAVAGAMGLKSLKADSAASLEETFAEALAADGPVLLEITIPRRSYDGLI